MAPRREVRLVVEGCPGAAGTVDWATSLSVEGMRLDRRLPVWPDSELALRLHLGDGREPVALRAVVVAGGPGTAVRFVDVAVEGRARIAAYVRR